MVDVAERIQKLPPYIFAVISQMIAEETAKGVDVISLGIGSPDLAPPQSIIDALYDSAKQLGNHGYPGYYGIPTMLQSLADYYGKRFNVELDPDTEVRPLLGSKEGLVNLSLAYIDPGDLVLVPDPSYPTYRMGTLMAGGEFYPMALDPENDWLIDFNAIPMDVAGRAKIMWLNYPNNPTGAIAPMSFLKEAVDFCREHDILLGFDNPYAEVTFDDYVAPSILEVPGAKDVAIEFNSMSKTYNMAGWRLGMAVGNADAVKALTKVKTNVDSGIFKPVQEAGVAAFIGDQSWIKERNKTYQVRRDIILDWVHKLGMTAEPPKGGLYVWAKVPEGVDCADYCTAMLKKAGVWMTPGTAYGENGNGYIRLSLCVPKDRLREAGERLLNV